MLCGAQCLPRATSRRNDARSGFDRIADDHPQTHVGGDLLKELADLGKPVSADVVVAANRLDLFYMGSRYPDAARGADPRAVVGVKEVIAAAEHACAIFAYARASNRVAGDCSLKS